MEYQLIPWLIFSGCSTFACILWFYLADRFRSRSGKSMLLGLLILVLGILLGTAGARGLWVLFRFFLHPPLFGLRIDELSYYGGMAGVLLAVFLSAKITGRAPVDVLNTFAPMGAFLAAMFRFGEYYLGMLGFGTYLEEGLFFPVTAELVWDETYSEFYLAVFAWEGILYLIAMILSLVHAKEKDRWLRTLFYLCLPQILCESLRIQSIRWLFVRSEQLLCFLVCEGILVFDALRRNPRRFLSWLPALAGLAVCGLIIGIEFALDGKITVGGQRLPHWLLYSIMALGLCGMAAAEHLGRKPRSASEG